MPAKADNNLTVNIVPFKDEHFSEAERLLDEFPEIFPTERLRVYRNDLLSYLINRVSAKEKAFVLLVDNSVVGLILFGQHEESNGYYEVWWLVVRKDYQGRGYGKRLVKTALKYIREREGRAVMLETSNETHNKYTKLFYESLGFKRVGVLPNYFYPPRKSRLSAEDCAIYYKTLS